MSQLFSGLNFYLVQPAHDELLEYEQQLRRRIRDAGGIMGNQLAPGITHVIFIQSALSAVTKEYRAAVRMKKVLVEAAWIDSCITSGSLSALPRLRQLQGARLSCANIAAVEWWSGPVGSSRTTRAIDI
jgi:hypothetical protein